MFSWPLGMMQFRGEFIVEWPPCRFTTRAIWCTGA
jgi:hypothetical protein